MSLLVKICGVSTPDALDAAIDAGADLIGLVFHPKSPRFVGRASAAALAGRARTGTGRSVLAGRGPKIVALVVDPDDASLDAIIDAVRPDFLQLHGAETPARVSAIRSRAGVGTIKAIGVAAPADLEAARSYAHTADLLLIDARPPKEAAYPGGHGRAFDWSILSGFDPGLPWLMSGGLDPVNVAAAIAAGGAGRRFAGVDVSSGVESAPGVKDPEAIRAFIAAARRATGTADFAHPGRPRP